ncbi:hypothetical protein, variant 1 [Blastomyces dermatitidis ER-3]|uniref:Rootletin n=1 Tax=Ajellomyces dermatitidis (strain ER-3 / ATCC MYA-2586) TaxID=559297 RepID=A0ABX2VU44_AJEDR|nr:uncharacterized protein BDCG_03416 [Blastomyces dermatitidis ER-3]XP_045280431.1 hypothetical protein, variant 1 [Blastomyces dermatitidis ER-3]OAT00703.1 hypothetical protein BDCG_03416 [Blastomyces dermatitidis ER-3]OAT00704.1 hypothetical protein, variant 1 [Blastomyces dermatitidis ER-3]
MTSNPLGPLGECRTMGEDLFSVNLPSDEAGLSPTSKKILEKCAIPVTPVSLNSCFQITPTLISRPPNSDLETGEFNFHFAKPKLPTPNFTSRLKAKPAGSILASASNQKVIVNPSGTNCPDSNCTESSSSGTSALSKDSAINSGQVSPTKSPITHDTAERTCGPTAGIHRSSKETGHSLEIGDRADSQSENDALEKDSNLATNHTQSAQSPNQDPTGPIPNTDNCNSPASARSHSGNPKLTPPRPSAMKATPQPKLMVNSKVTKHPMSAKSVVNGVATKQVTLQKGSSSAFQPSEEDLFYMLIRKLKKRDEMEAEATAMKERMKDEMLALTRTNDDLRSRLRESQISGKSQQERLNASNSLVERWKTKFSKLRTFVTSVGSDFESLRKEGQILKSTQESLLQEKNQIHETLKQMSDSTGSLKTRWSQHRATIVGVRQEFNTLEKSLLTATTRVTETEKLLSRERNHVATLENYIKNHSDRHHKQALDIDERQSQMIKKIDTIHKHIESWNSAQSSIKDELESGFTSCMSLLKSLSQQQTLKPQDLEKVDCAIRDLSMQLHVSIEASKKNMEVAFDLHTNYGQRVSSQLTGLETAVKSNTEVVCQLAEARELHGNLQEKLNAADKSLHMVSADRDRLKSQEASLQRRIRDLEIEISSLQKNKIEDAQFRDADMSSELQIQLEATSASLTEVSNELKEKQSEISDLELKLTDTIERLAAAESEIAGLTSERLKIRDEAQKTEHRVREELTRANLAAKDQHRAWFEQERHKLKREKILAEKSAQKVAEELNSVKISLEAAEKGNHELVAKMSQQQSEIDSLKMTASKRDSNIAAEMDEVNMLHASTIQELQSAQWQLEAATKEKEELRHQLSELRMNLATLQEQEPLQETVEVLQYEIAEKDINLLSLKEELSKSEENNKTISQLQQEVADKSAEIAILRERLDNQLTSVTTIGESLKEKNNELIILEQKMEAFGKLSAETSALKRDIEQRDNELAELRSRVQESNVIFKNTESILRQLGIIGTMESLRDYSNVLQSRLKMMAGSLDGRQPKEPIESGLHIPMRISSKRQRTSRKRSMSSTHAECARPGSSSRERQTTEIVYRTRSTREIISPTLKTPSRGKNANSGLPTTSTSFIRPFSRLQNETTPAIYPGEQMSPVLEFTDLNALFPTTPMNAKNVGSNQARMAAAQNSLPSDKVILPCEVARTKERSALCVSDAVNDAICTSRRDKECEQSRGSIEAEAPHEATGNEPAAAASTPNKCRIDNNLEVQDNPCSPPKTIARTLKRKKMSEDEMHTMQGKKVASQKSPEKLPRTGILKDTTKPTSSTIETVVETPPHENSGETPMGASPKITFRRPSRKSKYFNPTNSPAASITAMGGRCGSTTKKSHPPAGRVRERPRRRQRGDLYHNRFSQKPPG